MNADSDLLNSKDLPGHRSRQFFQAYVAMALRARVRSEAPSDGLLHTDPTEEELEDPEILRSDAIEYAKEMFARDEDAKFKLLGSVDGSCVKAFAYTMHAARLMCSHNLDKPFVEQLAAAEMKSS